MIYLLKPSFSKDWPGGNLFKDKPDGPQYIAPRKPLDHGRLSPKIVSEIKECWLTATASSDCLPHFLKLPTRSAQFFGFVDKEVAQLIEELDPDLHQTIELRNIWSTADKSNISGYFAINIFDFADTVNLELSKINDRKMDPSGSGRELVAINIMVPENCVVNGRSQGDRNIWRDYETRHIFCSQEFRDRSLAIGVEEVEFMETTVI